MTTPIYDFVKKYQSISPFRLHMPGHKGMGPLGIEQFDITEIDGADVLYSESGILQESQENASVLFGSARTFYSTEGATLCIRAMLAMIQFYAKELDREPIIAACRNAHKSFITSCALLDIDPIWVTTTRFSLLSCNLTANELENFFSAQESLPVALYLTSPDYLGNMMDLPSIAKVCHANGVLLIVDNAHGAYLHFLPTPAHPLDLGADLVCDSAHKTLPVLTGGAYLHVSKNAPEILKNYGVSSLSLFSSTSPSYLILQSLDLCNKYLTENYSKKLFEFSAALVDLKKNLRKIGFQIIGDEPLKITILAKPYGYLGDELSTILKTKNVYVEFSDPDFVVLMLSPEQGIDSLKKIFSVFSEIEARKEILDFPPKIPLPLKERSPREAIFSSYEKLPIENCQGRILAQPGVTCPPAIPIAICGEKITLDHIKAFSYYKIKEISVVKK